MQSKTYLEVAPGEERKLLINQLRGASIFSAINSGVREFMPAGLERISNLPYPLL